MTTLTGTGSPVRLALRRDRLILTGWIVLLILTAAGSTGATVDAPLV